MLLSRFWIIVLAVIAAAATAAGYIAHGRYADTQRTDGNERLLRDRFIVEAQLRFDARTQIDVLAEVAADNDLRAALRAASTRRDDAELAGLNQRAKPLLQRIARSREHPIAAENDILFALDHRGVVVAQLGPDERNFGGSFETFPLVRSAYRGYMGDDVWFYKGTAYRMAARPVIEGSSYVGVIVLGKPFDARYAEALSQRTGGGTVGQRQAVVAFFHAANVFASAVPTAEGTPALGQAEVASGLPTGLGDAHLSRGEPSEPVDLGGRGLAIYALVQGSAAQQQVGYAIARAHEVPPSPIQLLLGAGRGDLRNVPFPLVLGIGLGGVIIAFLLMFLERDRPLRGFRKGLESLAGSPTNRLDLTTFGGPFRKLAQLVNEAMDKSVEHAATAAPRKKADLDDILGDAPKAPAANAFFQFASPAEIAPEEQRPSEMFPDFPSAPLPKPPPAEPAESFSSPAPAAMETSASAPEPPAAPPPRSRSSTAADLVMSAPAKQAGPGAPPPVAPPPSPTALLASSADDTADPDDVPTNEPTLAAPAHSSAPTAQAVVPANVMQRSMEANTAAQPIQIPAELFAAVTGVAPQAPAPPAAAPAPPKAIPKATAPGLPPASLSKPGAPGIKPPVVPPRPKVPGPPGAIPPGAAPPSPAAAAPTPAAPATGAGARKHHGTLMGIGVDGAALAAAAAAGMKPGAPVAPKVPSASDNEEGQTMVAAVPDSLLQQTASGPKLTAAQTEEQHFKETFEAFVATKKQCGEPTAGFTYEKFVQTLRKNKEQIVTKHGARSVRFTVYVKDGKAALKASPVKD